jgi:sugar phosphate permease
MALTQTPARPRAGRLFYGWWIVLVTFAMAFYYSGIYFYAFTLFVTPITDELPTLGAHISPAFLVSGIVGAVLAPFLGSVFDKRGPKLVVGGGLFLGGLGFLLLGRMTEPWHLYIALPLAGIGPIVIWNGAIPAIANWFVRLRGRTLGLTTMGLGLGGLLTSPSLALMDAYGWRTAFVIMAVGILVLLMPLALVLRRRPEDYGQLPDGDEAPVGRGEGTVEGPALQSQVEDGLTFRQVMRAPAFWLIALVFSLAFWPIGGLQIYMAPFMEDVGFSRTMAAFAVGAMAVIGVSGRLGGGWLADLIDPRKATALALLLQATGTAAFALAAPDRVWLLVLFLATFSPGFGAITVLQPALLGVFFGRRAFGAVQGILWTVTSVSFSLAPLVWLRLSDALESGRPGYGIFAALSVVGALVVLLLPRPGLLSKK